MTTLVKFDRATWPMIQWVDTLEENTWFVEKKEYESNRPGLRNIRTIGVSFVHEEDAIAFRLKFGL